MTDKLHCPFCGAELETEGIWATPICPNKSCRYYGIKIPEEIWQALIEGKKAQDALKKARELYKSLAISYCKMGDDFRTSYGRLKTFEQEAEEYMQDYDKEIASITKQDIKE